MRHYPETPPPGIYSDNLNKHLHSVWCNVRNDVLKDQDGVKRCLEGIRQAKQTIRFLQERIVANKKALDAIETIKENA